MTARWQKYILDFKFEAGTSRGILKQKNTWFIKLSDEKNPTVVGIGECGPLVGLSPDDRPDFESKLTKTCLSISNYSFEELIDCSLLEKFKLELFPSILFGIETALLDYKNKGCRIIFPSSFTEKSTAIPINGLIWMGNEKFMQQQLEEKLQQNYNCIKIKIGALDFETELNLIKSIRKNYSPEQITIRLDANGAFSFDDAKEKIKILSEYHIHSIEQPIKAGQTEKMRLLCADTNIPIALDEEIIGIKSKSEKQEILDTIKPQYIILKPTLVGGLAMTKEWIDLAEERNINWWITSALESNIGLNAIAQFTATLNPKIPQGLGTGQLYHNNIDSPLTIRKGNLYYDTAKTWNLISIS
jgi:O-succinylbenzoate synthase